MIDPISKALAKQATMLLKAYEAAEKWKSNRQNKSSNVTQKQKKDLSDKSKDKGVQPQ